MGFMGFKGFRGLGGLGLSGSTLAQSRKVLMLRPRA